MSTATSSSSNALDSTQRDWVVKMGGILGVKVSSQAGANVPLTGVNPEVLWEQKQKAVDAADAIVREFEDAQISKAPVFRKGIVQVRALAQQQQFTEAVKTFAELEPKINDEYAKFQKARGGGVQDSGDGANKPAGSSQATSGPKSAASPAGDGAKPAAAADDPKAAEYKKQILKVGSKGPAVEYLQKTLGQGLGVDGKFGPGTQKAVQAFQTSKGLKPDGIVGPKTWGALGGGASGADAPPSAKSAGAGSATAGSGAAAKAGGSASAAKGFISSAVGKAAKNLPDDVKAIQEALNQRGGANLPTDGKFSPQVQKAIEEFQKKIGQFNPDGIILPGRGPANVLSGAAKMPPTPPEPKPIAPPVLGKATLDKGAFVWHSTREILQTNIEELKKGVLAAYGTEHQDLLDAIDKSMADLNKVIDKLDTRLSDVLDAAYNAPTDEARIPQLKKAEGLMNEYLAYVKAEPLIDHMDDNPFGVKTSLKKVITDALNHLSELLPEPAVART